MRYRCTHQSDSVCGDPLPLVDALTPQSANSISLGRMELESLAEYLTGEIANAQEEQSQPGTRSATLKTQ